MIIYKKSQNSIAFKVHFTNVTSRRESVMVEETWLEHRYKTIRSYLGQNKSHAFITKMVSVDPNPRLHGEHIEKIFQILIYPATDFGFESPKWTINKVQILIWDKFGSLASKHCVRNILMKQGWRWTPNSGWKGVK